MVSDMGIGRTPPVDGGQIARYNATAKHRGDYPLREEFEQLAGVMVGSRPGLVASSFIACMDEQAKVILAASYFYLLVLPY